MIKKIKNAFKLWNMLRTSNMDFAWFKIVEGIMNFALEVQKHGKPMLTKICVVDMSKEKDIGDFDMVSIWAAVGEANPIERIRHLKNQNNALKELLTKCKNTIEVGGNDDLILNINLVLDTFE